MPLRSAALAVAVLLASGGIAIGGPRVLFAPVYGEDDVLDEATAVHLLVRSAFPADDPTAIADVVGPNPTLDEAVAALTAVDGQHLVLIEVDRLGPTLIGTLQIIDRTGAVAGKLATQAGDGGVTELAVDIAREIARVTGVPAAELQDHSTGQLRPFSRAFQLANAGKPEDAARALAGADPLIALRVSAAGTVARNLWKNDKIDPAARLIACIVACTPREVMSLTTSDRSAAARSARALAQVGLSDAAAASLELVGMPMAADTALARAAIAHLRQDLKLRDTAIADLINAPDVEPIAVAWLAKLPPGVLAPGLEGGVVHLGESVGSKRLAAAIGLRAAEACEGATEAPAGSASPDGSGSAAGPTTDDAAPTVCTGLGGMLLDRPLAMISVLELDRRERTRLKPIVAKAGGTEAMRLIAELAFSEADHTTAQAALVKLKRSTDPRAAMYRGRIAWGLGDLALAAEELGNAGAVVEQARVQLAKGDAGAAAKSAGNSDRSRLVKVANAEIALAESRPADAVKHLRDAEKLAPGDRDTQVRLANALELSGDLQAARKVRARLIDLAEAKGLAKAPVAAGSGSGSGSGSADAAHEFISTGRLAVRQTLRDLLATFPPAALNGNSLVIAPIGAAPTGWALREVDPAPLLRELRAVLEIVHQARTVGEAGRRLPDRPSAGELSAMATSYGADGVLAYAVNTDGDVRLVVYDSATGSAYEQHGRIDIDALDMVHWNLRWLIIPVGIIGVVLAFVLLMVVRGSAILEVKVVRDPEGSNEVLIIELQKTKHRWKIRDLEAFRESTTAGGAKVGRRTAYLVGDLTKFKVPPGHWYVHMYGLYDRPGGVRTLDEEHTIEVDVERSSRKTVEVDLVPRTAEVRVRILDENGRGVMVWIDEGAKVYTDGKGEAVVYSPMGHHTLHVEAQGIRLDRALSFKTPVTETHEFDFEGKLANTSRPGVSRSGMSSPGMAAASMSGIRARTTSQSGTPRPSTTSPGATRAAVSMSGMSQSGIRTPTPASKSMPGGKSMPGSKSMPGTKPAADSSPGATSSPHLQLPPASDPDFKEITNVEMQPPKSVAKMAKNATLPSAAGRAIANEPRPDLLCGRYRIVKTLGRGAMGVVYRAHDEHLEREVAIKVLASELRHHPEALRFFIEEAKALAQLNHPNIVSVFDQTSDGNETYLVMEFVDGRTLDSLLEEKTKLPPHTALALIDQLCAGLAYVHARRVIHRDIKPANIFVSRDRIVKLGDFGLARVMRELSIRKTEIRGTPLYMAPEQITGENVTHRSDLYAVGCTLFELVTGRPPFMDGEILYHHLHTKPPKPSDFEPSLSPAFDALVLECIVKDADQRIDSANAIRERIRAIGMQSMSNPSIKVV